MVYTKDVTFTMIYNNFVLTAFICIWDSSEPTNVRFHFSNFDKSLNLKSYLYISNLQLSAWSTTLWLTTFGPIWILVSWARCRIRNHRFLCDTVLVAAKKLHVPIYHFYLNLIQFRGQLISQILTKFEFQKQPNIPKL